MTNDIYSYLFAQSSEASEVPPEKASVNIRCAKLAIEVLYVVYVVLVLSIHLAHNDIILKFHG